MGRITSSRTQIKPDPRYNSVLASKFINCLMRDGKKSVAQGVFYDALDVIGKKITVVGAGGAATAIEIQAALDGVKEISIFNIKDKFYEAGENTVRKINEKIGKDRHLAVKGKEAKSVGGSESFTVTGDVIEALHAYDVKAAPWSRRDQFIADLAN